MAHIAVPDPLRHEFDGRGSEEFAGGAVRDIVLLETGIQKALRQVLQELFAVFQHGGTFGFLPVAIFTCGAETAGFKHIPQQFCKVVLAEVVHGVKTATVRAVDLDFAGFVGFNDFHIPELSFRLGCWG